MSGGLTRALGAEVLGSFLLTATVVGSGVMAESLAGGNVAVALLGNTIATGAMLFVLIHALGPISGAHFNPAVTLVMAIRREASLARLAAFVPLQILGCCAGVIFAHAMFDLPLSQVSDHVRAGGGPLLGEGAATFALLSTILFVSKHRNETVPAAVALVITAGYWWTSSTSFANPAITVARALTDTFAGIRPEDAPGFIAAQLAGALLALFVFGLLGGRPTKGAWPAGVQGKRAVHLVAPSLLGRGHEPYRRRLRTGRRPRQRQNGPSRCGSARLGSPARL